MHHNKAFEIKNLHYKYPDGTVALNNVNITVEHGESIALLGPNGAGKSTLILHLNGILRGDGEIKVFGLPINKYTLKEIRRRVGLVFQDPDDQLFCPTVFEDVAFGLVNMGLTEEKILMRTSKALASVGMEGFEKHSAYHLSFGQKKRVAIATVLSMEPDILVLDEPTSNLDPRGRGKIIKILDSLPVTKVVVTHNLNEAAKLCKRAIIIDEGKIVADDEIEKVLSNQSILETHGLISP
ncbi:ABC transporter ATP-binding protein [Candidatus Oleimmundimicrobium sp.]|uniref:energy-coupling factor ABC transporter ATP-binding protein n=1 Tax=Candidatus Oleimmundimicrobium sp. TaxID=3060597 RepID=UPI002723F942|nr:ABC transporter ATP-binding protein [Candidatus Oleimmundimicrobium sp.]MDO8885671.1 ABC transporter ATP-binding protein [Candidatus Oleimmundimicrobium sp.]